MYYVRHVLPDVLPLLDERLEQAWSHVGFEPALIRDPGGLPRLRVGTWVGGDRDGHPLVTAEVTRETLEELRLDALLLVHGQLVDLLRYLSLSDLLQAPPAVLGQRIEATAEGLGERGRAIVARNPDESWRQWVGLMLARLPVEITRSNRAGLAGDAVHYGSPRELADDLSLLYRTLVEIGAEGIARKAVRPVLRSVQTFGFHGAVLDVRQNSAFHDRPCPNCWPRRATRRSTTPGGTRSGAADCWIGSWRRRGPSCAAASRWGRRRTRSWTATGRSPSTATGTAWRGSAP